MVRVHPPLLVARMNERMNKENEMTANAKEIVYCYVDGKGEEQVQTYTAKEQGELIGYSFEEQSVRIWMSNIHGQETVNIPLERVVFVREVETY